MPFDPARFDLSGAYLGDDGGIYYVRQVGSVVWWNGMSGRTRPPSDLGRGWNNVARGEINGVEIEAEWADVPRGDPYGTGTLSLIVADDGTGNLEIRKEGETGTGFENTTWTPCKAA